MRLSFSQFLILIFLLIFLFVNKTSLLKRLVTNITCFFKILKKHNSIRK